MLDNFFIILIIWAEHPCPNCVLCHIVVFCNRKRTEFMKAETPELQNFTLSSTIWRNWMLSNSVATFEIVNIVNGRWSFRSIDWTVMVIVGVLLLRARRPGIRCQTVFATQLWVFLSIFRHRLKTPFLAKYWWDVLSTYLEIFMTMHFTYLPRQMYI